MDVERTLAQARLRRLIAAAREVATSLRRPGSALKVELGAATHLSAEGIDFALDRSLELAPSDAELHALCASAHSMGFSRATEAGSESESHDLATHSAPGAVWIVLSANVFVAAHRAIALGLALSGRVYVKPSRRDPVFARALHAADPDLFGLVDAVNPLPGDCVHAYGADETMQALRAALSEGVAFHSHGSGLGAAFISEQDDLALAASALAEDIVLFDQRGCLSPRIVVLSPSIDAEAFARRLGGALEALSVLVPPGARDAADRAEVTWYKEVTSYVGQLVFAGAATVGLFQPGPQIPIAPAQRCVSVLSSGDPGRVLAALEPQLTTVGANCPRLRTLLALSYPRARVARLGFLQRPAFDGPVDMRQLRGRVAADSSVG